MSGGVYRSVSNLNSIARKSKGPLSRDGYRVAQYTDPVIDQDDTRSRGSKCSQSRKTMAALNHNKIVSPSRKSALTKKANPISKVFQTRRSCATHTCTTAGHFNPASTLKRKNSFNPQLKTGPTQILKGDVEKPLTTSHFKNSRVLEASQKQEYLHKPPKQTNKNGLNTSIRQYIYNGDESANISSIYEHASSKGIKMNTRYANSKPIASSMHHSSLNDIKINAKKQMYNNGSELPIKSTLNMKAPSYSYFNKMIDETIGKKSNLLPPKAK